MDKQLIKNEIISKLQNDAEIEKIILFGSFSKSNAPNDVDIAIFSNSDKDYLTLALYYRKLLRDLARQIPLDIVPLKNGQPYFSFLDEIYSGEVIYERRN